MRDILIIICIAALVVLGLDYYLDGRFGFQAVLDRINFQGMRTPDLSGPGKFGQALGQAFGFAPKGGGAN